MGTVEKRRGPVERQISRVSHAPKSIRNMRETCHRLCQERSDPYVDDFQDEYHKHFNSPKNLKNKMSEFCKYGYLSRIPKHPPIKNGNAYVVNQFLVEQAYEPHERSVAGAAALQYIDDYWPQPEDDMDLPETRDNVDVGIEALFYAHIFKLISESAEESVEKLLRSEPLLNIDFNCLGSIDKDQLPTWGSFPDWDCRFRNHDHHLWGMNGTVDVPENSIVQNNLFTDRHGEIRTRINLCITTLHSAALKNNLDDESDPSSHFTASRINDDEEGKPETLSCGDGPCSVVEINVKSDCIRFGSFFVLEA